MKVALVLVRSCTAAILLEAIAGVSFGPATGAVGPALPPVLATSGFEGSWRELVPDARDLHCAVYDPVRDRMLVFGGFGQFGMLGDVWSLSLAGPPAWTALTPVGSSPGAREGASAVYDPVRDRVLLFGGLDSSYVRSNEVWVLTLSDPPTWTRLAPDGAPPAGRWGHSAVYDPVRDRMVVFGGLTVNDYLNDVWSLSLAGTPAWTSIAPSGSPTPRFGHVAIYDPIRDRMVLFGGGSGGLLYDVWSLSLSGAPAWTNLTPAAGHWFLPRDMHSAIYDPVRDCMLVFGGLGPSFTNLDDLWALSLAGTPTWSALSPSGSRPGGRYGHTAIYDPLRARMLLFGGFSAANETWALNLSGPPSWATLTGPSPSPRYDQSAIFDPPRDRTLVFGGFDGSMHNEIWALSSASTWSAPALVGPAPSPRRNHSAIYDPPRDRMVIFGGIDSSHVDRNDVWALSLLNPPTWTMLTPSGTPPGPRDLHSTIYDPVRDRMIVFGGEDANGYLADVWALSLADPPAWTALTPEGTPPSARMRHSAIYDPVRDRMVVFGGYDGSYLGDVWSLTLGNSPAWTALTPGGVAVGPRAGHSAIYDPSRERMIVFGGRGADAEYHNDVPVLSLAEPAAWTTAIPAGASPRSRYAHSAVYDPVLDRMVIFGGYDSSEYFFLNDAWAMSLASVVAVEPARQSPTPDGLRVPVPNPSGGTTRLSYSIARPGRVQLGIYDLGGRLLRRLVDGERPAGAETVVWNGVCENGSRSSAGIYFVRLVGPGLQVTRKLIRIR